MQVNRIALLLAMLFNLSDLNAMDKNFKYYSSFYSNYTHPFQVKAEDKISEKEALSKKTYYKVLFESKNNIKRIKKYLTINVYLFLNMIILLLVIF
jgi:hypothetical protein